MSEPYLIAHVVRQKPAFDIAEQIKCPVCEPMKMGLDNPPTGCDACDYEGFWWIIPTSGHRARPYWYAQLSEWYIQYDDDDVDPIIHTVPPPPEGWPDHYACNNSSPSPAAKGGDLDLEELGLI